MTNKTTRNKNSVDEFINSIEDTQRQKDSKDLVKLMSEATGTKPEMWGSSIVGFGSYTYKYASGRQGEWPRVGFSPRKNNLTVYIMTGFDEYADNSGYDPSKHLGKLGPHSTGKSCLYIKQLTDIDVSVLSNLVKESFEAMSDSKA